MKVPKHPWAAAAGLLLSLCASAISGTIRDDRDDQLYLDLGAWPEFACVGRVDGATRAYDFLASGTLISPQWVLTAGHVVKGATQLQFSLGGVPYLAAGWIAHPKYSGDLWSGYDIALIRLSAPVTVVAPAVRYDGGDELGKVAYAAGYGMTGTGLSGADTPDFRKRAGTNVIDSLQASRKSGDRLMLMDFDNPHNPYDSYFGSQVPLDLEYLIAPGDSGGGLFADFGAGLQLVGVHSFGAAWDGLVDSDYGDLSGHIRVSSLNSWIDSVLSGVPTKPGKGKKTDLEIADLGLGIIDLGMEIGQFYLVPEPASLGLLALGLAGLIRRRRR